MLCGKFGFWAMFTRRVASMWWEEETWLYVFRMLLFYFFGVFCYFCKATPLAYDRSSGPGSSFAAGASLKLTSIYS